MIDPRRVFAWTMLLVGTATTFALLAQPQVPDAAASAPSLLEIADDEDAMLVPVEARTEAIEQELAELDKIGGGHPWAGHYYQGDGLGANISFVVSPVAGAAVTWHGCLGLYGANEGGLTQREDGTIDLAFNWKNQEGGFGGFPSHLVPVAWGKRSYLIPPDRLVDFVSAINGGLEPRDEAHGIFYLRDDDYEIPVEGLPALPQEYLDLVRTRNVEFAVRNVERLPDTGTREFCKAHWRITIDTGGDDRLRAGIDLELADPSRRYLGAKVVEVNPSTAVLEYSAYGEFAKGAKSCAFDANDATPDLTWRFATGYYPRKREG